MNQKEVDNIISKLPEAQRREYLSLVDQVNTVLHGASITTKLLVIGNVGQKLLEEPGDDPEP